MLTLLLIVLVLAAIGSVPTWRHSRSWGYYPSAGLGVVLVVVLLLMMSGRV
jgi:hypothetical protein